MTVTFTRPTRMPVVDRRGTTHQEWSTATTDGHWTVERSDEAGTPWIATYLPTGQEERFGNIDIARRWIKFAGDEAVALFLERARADALDMTYSATYRQTAQARVAILTDALVWGISPEARCECGGYVAYLTGEWVHASTCGDCYDPYKVAPAGDCLAWHEWCGRPAPAPCGHCGGASSLVARSCDHGRTVCCGCCHKDPS